MNKAVIAIVVVLLVGGGIFAATKLGKRDNQSSTTTTQHNESQSTQNSSVKITTDSAKSGSVELDIEDFAFSATTLKVKKGTKVTWTNRDSVAHTVTSDSDSEGGLDSPLLSDNQTYSFTFNSVGTYSYHCTPHPSMTATVEVVE